MESRTLPRVFIADASAAVIERLAATLGGVAQVMGCATNAHDAIDGIRNGNPQITVLDIAIDGVELLRQIKKHKPPVAVIILTHSIEEATRQACLRLGAEYFLDKIRDYDKVREIVSTFGMEGIRSATAPPNR